MTVYNQLVVYGVAASATASFTYNSTANSTTLNNLSIGLAFADSQNIFKASTVVTYNAVCTPGLKGYTALGNVFLNVSNTTSTYALNGAYYPCAAAAGDVVWNITAAQVGTLMIYDASITNATMKLTGTYNGTNITLADNSTTLANGTVWSGIVSGSFKYPPFTATGIIEFNTTVGVKNFRANIGYRSNALDVDMSVVYDHGNLACTSPSPLTSVNTSRLLGPGESGTATITIRGVGQSNLTLTGSAAHDYCADIWQITGSLVGTWQVYDINITNLAVLLYAYRSSNDTNSTYLWQGSVTGSAYVASIGITTTVKVTFDPVIGLTGVFARVQESTSFGQVMVDLLYTNSNNTCSNTSSVGVQTISGVGTLLGNFTDASFQLQVGVNYDLCTKNMIFNGSTIAPVSIQQFNVTNTTLGFTRKYDSVSNTSTFGELFVRGVITVIGMLLLIVIHF